MSEKILKFLLTELVAVRLKCKSKACGGVFELPIDKLEDRFRRLACPLCGNIIRKDDQTQEDELFSMLGQVVRRFKEGHIKDKIEVELVLPDKD